MRVKHRVVLKEKIGLWRIIDWRTKKPLRTRWNRAVDDGGQRTELDAWRLLRVYENQPPTRASSRAEAKRARIKRESRLRRIAANVEGRKLAKCRPG